MRTENLRCLSCGEKLVLQKTCRSAVLSCRVCGRKYPLDKFLQDMDDAFEEALGNTRCDRL